MYYININETPNLFIYFTFFLAVKGAIYYVAIATVIFSHVKISCFLAKAHLVFHWRCLYTKYDYFVFTALDLVIIIYH